MIEHKNLSPNTDDLTHQANTDTDQNGDVQVAGFSHFADLPLTKSTQDAVLALGFEQLTPIQAQVLPLTLAYQDAIGQAQTGTGKTAAFLITIIEFLLKKPFAPNERHYLGEPRALVLAPTRELAQQIYADCRALTRFSALYSVCLIGGSDFERQQKDLDKQPVDILIGTPGRVMDWMSRKKLFLDRVEVFVLDEADRMLDMGFIPDIKRIIHLLPPKTHRQSLLFSATFNADVMNLAYRWLYNPVFIEIAKSQKTNANIKQRFFWLSDEQKLSAIEHLLKQDLGKAIIFANRKDQVRYLSERLKSFGVVDMSGDIAQNKRERHLKALKDGKAKVLIATDVAGRGIHVDDVQMVINFNLPECADDYVHRIGRTGRAGQMGLAISLIGESDGFHLPNLEKHLQTSFKIESFDFHHDLLINRPKDEPSDV